MAYHHSQQHNRVPGGHRADYEATIRLIFCLQPLPLQIPLLSYSYRTCFANYYIPFNHYLIRITHQLKESAAIIAVKNQLPAGQSMFYLTAIFARFVAMDAPQY